MRAAQFCAVLTCRPRRSAGTGAGGYEARWIKAAAQAWSQQGTPWSFNCLLIAAALTGGQVGHRTPRRRTPAADREHTCGPGPIRTGHPERLRRDPHHPALASDVIVAMDCGDACPGVQMILAWDTSRLAAAPGLRTWDVSPCLAALPGKEADQSDLRAYGAESFTGRRPAARRSRTSNRFARQWSATSRRVADLQRVPATLWPALACSPMSCHLHPRGPTTRVHIPSLLGKLCARLIA